MIKKDIFNEKRVIEVIKLLQEIYGSGAVSIFNRDNTRDNISKKVDMLLNYIKKSDSYEDSGIKNSLANFSSTFSDLCFLQWFIFYFAKSLYLMNYNWIDSPYTIISKGYNYIGPFTAVTYHLENCSNLNDFTLQNEIVKLLGKFKIGWKILNPNFIDFKSLNVGEQTTFYNSSVVKGTLNFDKQLVLLQNLHADNFINFITNYNYPDYIVYKEPQELPLAWKELEDFLIEIFLPKLYTENINSISCLFNCDLSQLLITLAILDEKNKDKYLDKANKFIKENLTDSKDLNLSVLFTADNIYNQCLKNKSDQLNISEAIFQLYKNKPSFIYPTISVADSINEHLDDYTDDEKDIIIELLIRKKHNSIFNKEVSLLDIINYNSYTFNKIIPIMLDGNKRSFTNIESAEISGKEYAS